MDEKWFLYMSNVAVSVSFLPSRISQESRFWVAG